MKKSVIGAIVISILVLSSILASCATSTTTKTTQPVSTTSTQTVGTTSTQTVGPTSTQTPGTTPVQNPVKTTSSTKANWWDSLGTPQYGGSFTQAFGNFDINFDAHDPRGLLGYEFDGLFFYDWSVDPKIHSYQNEFVEPEYHVGILAKSWEQTDPLTVTVRLREGVKWQDKAPVNGREFTADDVAYNFDRILGTGSGFTQPNPFIGNNFMDISKVVATDKYTVQIKLKRSTAFTINQVMSTPMYVGFIAKEWVDQGDMTNWKNAVGTGPYILSDLIPGGSMTFSRNPNYFGHDERYPQNQLPYADTSKVVIIRDLATQLASLRTAKIDYSSFRVGGPTWQELANIKKTDPGIEISSFPVEGYSLEFNSNNKPFSDMRVRKAMQMAIDLQTIAQSYYGGTVDGKPAGLINPINKDWIVPYDKWPADLQQEYSYNISEARTLMSESGYPNGFKTTMLVSTQQDQQIPQIVKSMYTDIGVDMTIEVMENSAFMTYCAAGNNDQMTFFTSTAVAWDPLTDLQMRTPLYWRNYTHVNDPTYNDMYDKVAAATDLDTAKSLAREAYMYELERHWEVHMFGLQGSILYQSYVKGLSGQVDAGPFFARIWIDQSIKK